MPTHTTNNQNTPLDLKSRSLFAKLKRLLSNDVVVRNVGGKLLKIKDTDQTQYATDRNTLRDRFNRVRSSGYSQYSRDFTLAYQASRIELFRDYDCVGPDTIIPLPDGTYPTIKELAEKYKDKPQERFYVFSYDDKTDSIKLGKAFHPRLKGPRIGYKVTFDNGKYIIGSLKHPFMMRDGSYKKILDLAVGDSVMPFYQKDYNCRYNKYKKLYNFSKGWQSEHVIVAEQFDRPLNEDEVVHHKNFNGYDNSPDNLQVMTKKDHTLFHSNYSKNILWGKENYEIQLNKLKSNPNYINRKINHWNGARIGKNNPFYGKTHTGESNKERSKTLKAVFVNRNQIGDKNPNHRGDLTIDVLKVKATNYYKEHGKLTSWEFAQDVGCDYSVLQNRLKTSNLDWNTFKNDVVSTLNHKVVSIEPIGPIDVYDVTVDEFHNFATDSCFVANTMDMDPIISSALDIYADESLTHNELGQILTIKSDDGNIKQILHNLFYDIMNIEFNMWSWARNMYKYGDFYLKLHVSPEYGIYNVEPLSSYNVIRVENSDPQNKNYVKFQVSFESGVMEELENHQVAHFRLISDSNFAPYGKGMLEGARRVWKQLSLMEDAMLIHRIMRAPEKRVFKIDIGNIPPAEVDQYIEKMISKIKKVPYMDEKTGEYNLRFNLQNMVEDFFIPVRGSDSGTSIEPLPGMEFTGIEDVQYIRNKMMAALKIPKAFLGYEEDLSGKATLANEDVRFAKTIIRLQKILVSELNKIAVVHLFANGFTDESLVNFSLELTNPSTIFEKEKISIWQDKTNLAKDMLENHIFSLDWIYKYVFNISDDEVLKIKSQTVVDTKSAWRLKEIEEEGNDPATTFRKIKGAGDESTGGEAGGAPGGEAGGEPAGESGGEAGGEPGGEAGGTEAPPLTERAKRPSQAGEKDASKYPFGEDPLGNMENTAKTRSHPIRHKYQNNSPLSLESVSPKTVIQSLNLSGLKQHLLHSSDTKKEILLENKTNNDGVEPKSMLDESNILE